MSTVVHISKHDPKSPGLVYIGRANPRRGLAHSVFANPFILATGHTDEQRAESIGKYRAWAMGDEVIVKGGHTYDPRVLRARLPELAGKKLACWCAPKPCHGDVLIEMIAALDTRQEPRGAVLCVDCKLSQGPDHCGHWWEGRRHTCASFQRRAGQ